MLKLWDSIELIDKKVDEFIESNQYRLSWDARRSLKWTEHSDYYFVCEFNDWTSLIHETTSPEYLEEDEKKNPYHSSLIVPTEIFKKAKHQKDAIYTIEVPVKWLEINKDWTYDIEEYTRVWNENFENMMKEIEDVRRYMKNVSDFINNVVIAYGLNPDISINQTVRVAYPINSVLKFLSPWAITLLSYALIDWYETRINKEDNWLSFLFDVRSLFNEIINDTLFTKDRFGERQLTEDGYTRNICNLKLWFSNEWKDFVIKFDKTEELVDYIYNSEE